MMQFKKCMDKIKKTDRFICFKVILLTIIFLLNIVGSTGATSFNFDFSGNGLNGSGSLSLENIGGGKLTAVDGSIKMDGETFDLYPAFNENSFNLSPLGAFYYNNIVYSSAPYLDINGLLFTDKSGDIEVNIWGNGPATPYSVWEYASGRSYFSSNDNVAFNAVPEPSTLILLGVGVMGLGGLRLRKSAVRRRLACFS